MALLPPPDCLFCRITEKVVENFDEFFEGLGCVPSNKRLDFGVHLDHDGNPGILKEILPLYNNGQLYQFC